MDSAFFGDAVGGVLGTGLVDVEGWRCSSRLEAGIAAILVVLTVRRRGRTPRTVKTLLGGVCAVLLVQVAALRPVLDARTVQVIAGTPPPAAAWHLLYIALEVGKVALLVALGAATVLRCPPGGGPPDRR